MGSRKHNSWITKVWFGFLSVNNMYRLHLQTISPSSLICLFVCLFFKPLKIFLSGALHTLLSKFPLGNSSFTLLHLQCIFEMENNIAVNTDYQEILEVPNLVLEGRGTQLKWKLKMFKGKLWHVCGGTKETLLLGLLSCHFLNVTTFAIKLLNY